MEIKSSLHSRSYGLLERIYRDADALTDLPNRAVQAVHAYCFCAGKLVVVYAEKKGYWGPPGGAVEPGEGVEAAVVREVLEETNREVVSQRLIGYQEIFEPQGSIIQTRSVCIVRPKGEFAADPDGDVTEIKLIPPEEYKNYFDWGDVGDRQMQRALMLVKQMERV